jgi:signal transduction histidine kinase
MNEQHGGGSGGWHEHKNGDRPKASFIVIWIFVVIILFPFCFEAGLLIVTFVLDLNELISHLIAGLLGLLIFIVIMSVFKLFAELHARKHPEKRMQNISDHHASFLQSTLDAMNRISQGDFNILIPVDEHDPFSEVAQSVNKMASELSSMENLRQDFISDVSHEIQSPLTSIKGFAALLRSDALTAEQKESLYRRDLNRKHKTVQTQRKPIKAVKSGSGRAPAEPCHIQT